MLKAYCVIFDLIYEECPVLFIDIEIHRNKYKMIVVYVCVCVSI